MFHPNLRLRWGCCLTTCKPQAGDERSWAILGDKKWIICVPKNDRNNAQKEQYSKINWQFPKIYSKILQRILTQQSPTLFSPVFPIFIAAFKSTTIQFGVLSTNLFGDGEKWRYLGSTPLPVTVTTRNIAFSYHRKKHVISIAPTPNLRFQGWNSWV